MRRHVRRWTGVALLAAALGGCGAGGANRPITIAAALAELQAQLRAAGAVSASGGDPAAFDHAARAAQCEAGTADPEVPLLAREITVDLTGSFTAGGGFSVGDAVLGSGLSATATRGQTQSITLPLTFVALSNVPDATLAARLATLADLPAPERARQTEDAVARRDTLARRIDALVAGFRPELCRPAP